MSVSQKRVLAQLHQGRTVYVRAPDGQLSKATLQYASGRILKTHTRVFDAATGEQVNLPEGQEKPYTLYPLSENLDDEYAEQMEAAFERSRVAIKAKRPTPGGPPEAAPESAVAASAPAGDPAPALAAGVA